MFPAVALRKESVDRNCRSWPKQSTHHKSLSARRAWIEMDVTAKTGLFSSIVALRKESVDRNLIGSINRTVDISRSPQGERG